MKNERLTEKHESERTHVPNYIPKTNTPSKDVYEKLGQIEDLEEKLGIGFIALGKAVAEGFWLKNERGYIVKARVLYLEFDEFNFDWSDLFCSTDVDDDEDFEFDYVKLKDYGKTWALTKEELE